MKKITCIILTFIICLSFAGCNIKIDTDPDEWRILRDDSYFLENYNFDYLRLSHYNTELATFYDYEDMTTLFDLTKALVLTRSHESNHLPKGFDLLCSVVFFRQGTDGRPDVAYYYDVSTTGDICFIRDRIAAIGVVYIGNSTEILNEVNRLIELYNQS